MSRARVSYREQQRADKADDDVDRVVYPACGHTPVIVAQHELLALRDPQA